LLLDARKANSLLFCDGFQILRPRWPTLYAARKRRLDPTIGLPPLTDSFFGWIPRLYKVTEEQILASAGLDAFVVREFGAVQCVGDKTRD
jgi:hypothetical protein